MPCTSGFMMFYLDTCVGGTHARQPGYARHPPSPSDDDDDGAAAAVRVPRKTPGCVGQGAVKGRPVVLSMWSGISPW
jgi:hypothetical protein